MTNYNKSWATRFALFSLCAYFLVGMANLSLARPMEDPFEEDDVGTPNLPPPAPPSPIVDADDDSPPTDPDDTIESGGEGDGPTPIRIIFYITPEAIWWITEDASHIDDNNNVGEFIANILEDMNQVLLNSGLEGLFVFELAGIANIDAYDENNALDPGIHGDSSSLNGLMQILADAVGGGLTAASGSTLEELRDLLDADLGSIIASPNHVPDELSSAIGATAGFFNGETGADAVWLYALHEFIDDGTTSIHEVGHLAGLGHPFDDNFESDLRADDAIGYQQDDAFGRIGSIMMTGGACNAWTVHNQVSSCERVWRFADPTRDYVDKYNRNRGKLGDALTNPIQYLISSLEVMSQLAEVIDSEQESLDFDEQDDYSEDEEEQDDEDALQDDSEADYEFEDDGGGCGSLAECVNDFMDDLTDQELDDLMDALEDWMEDNREELEELLEEEL